MNLKFQVLVVDPPYEFDDKLEMDDVKRGAKANYNGELTFNELIKLPVSQIADPDGAILCLWVPSSLLTEGLQIMSSWGFRHTQTYVWVKTKKHDSLIKIIKKYKSLDVLISKLSLDIILNFYLGRLFRQTHEICLIGINNTKIYKKLTNKSQRSVSFSPVTKHSEKPDHLQNSLEKMFVGCNKIEMFGRRLKEGWLVVGNESPQTMNEDIRDTLNKLINNLNINQQISPA